MNMLALFILGPALEGIIGRARFLAVYVVGALGGSVAVLLASHPTRLDGRRLRCALRPARRAARA